MNQEIVNGLICKMNELRRHQVEMNVRRTNDLKMYEQMRKQAQEDQLRGFEILRELDTISETIVNLGDDGKKKRKNDIFIDGCYDNI